MLDLHPKTCNLTTYSCFSLRIWPYKTLRSPFPGMVELRFPRPSRLSRLLRSSRSLRQSQRHTINQRRTGRHIGLPYGVPLLPPRYKNNAQRSTLNAQHSARYSFDFPRAILSVCQSSFWLFAAALFVVQPKGRFVGQLGHGSFAQPFVIAEALDQFG